MSARAAGRIAAITTAKTLGVPVRQAAPEIEPKPSDGGGGGPLIPQVEPGAVIGAGSAAGWRASSPTCRRRR